MKRIIRTVFLSFLFLNPAFAMSIEEAYQAIPHKQTTFDLRSARMNGEEATFLQEFFKLVDLAMVERVQTLIWFQSHGTRGMSFQHYRIQIDKLLVQFNAMRVPKRIEGVHQRVVESVKEQKGYYADWQESVDEGQEFQFRLTAPGPQHPLVTSSHRKLIGVYEQLLQLFPQENQHNRQAFFDYLCALDFI